MLSCLANLRALLRCETSRTHYGRGIVYLQIEREIPLSQIGKLGRVQESERTPKSETEGDHTGAMASAANANETGGRDGTGVCFARAPGFSPPGDSKFSVSTAAAKKQMSSLMGAYRYSYLRGSGLVFCTATITNNVL